VDERAELRQSIVTARGQSVIDGQREVRIASGIIGKREGAGE